MASKRHSLLPFTFQPSEASALLVEDAMERKPTMFVDRVNSCHLRQLFRGVVCRALFTLFLAVGLVGSSWCSRDIGLTPLRRWLAFGFGINAVIGIPHSLAVVGSGVSVHFDGFSVEVSARILVSRRRMVCLSFVSIALTVWQCLWWMRGARLLASIGSRRDVVFYRYCWSCLALWPVALIVIQLLNRREQAETMKGTAASIMWMRPPRKDSVLSEASIDTVTTCAPGSCSKKTSDASIETVTTGSPGSFPKSCWSRSEVHASTSFESGSISRSGSAECLSQQGSHSAAEFSFQIGARTRKDRLKECLGQH